MKKRSSNILTYLSCLLVSLLCLGCGSKYDWFKTYQDEKNHVYGSYIIKRYIDNVSGNEKSDISRKLSKYFDEDEDRMGNYIFVGEAMLVDEFDAEALTDFVKAGNNAFIATNIFPNTISEIIFDPCREYIEEEEESIYYDEDDYDEETEVIDTVEYVELESWEYYDIEHFDFVTYGTEMVDMKLASNTSEYILTDTICRTWKNKAPRYRDWYYLHDSLACLAYNEITVLGHLNDTMINYFKLPYGDGTIYIHTSPFVFTNANFLNDKIAAYIEGILNEGGDKPWHWDEYSRTIINTGRMQNENSNMLSNKGPLTYILKQRSLKWAWYSLLAMGGFFMIFRAKRKQRVVPVVEKNENTSLAFINTIGTLYFNKNDHKQLCKDQMKMWLEDIRHYYRINTSKLDEDFVVLLSAKTKKSKEDIQGLLDYYNNIVNGGFVSENTMVTFYQKLNKFDIQSKS